MAACLFSPAGGCDWIQGARYEQDRHIHAHRITVIVRYLRPGPELADSLLPPDTAVSHIGRTGDLDNLFLRDTVEVLSTGHTQQHPHRQLPTDGPLTHQPRLSKDNIVPLKGLVYKIGKMPVAAVHYGPKGFDKGFP